MSGPLKIIIYEWKNINVKSEKIRKNNQGHCTRAQLIQQFEMSWKRKKLLVYSTEPVRQDKQQQLMTEGQKLLRASRTEPQDANPSSVYMAWWVPDLNPNHVFHMVKRTAPDPPAHQNKQQLKEAAKTNSFPGWCHWLSSNFYSPLQEMVSACCMFNISWCDNHEIKAEILSSRIHLPVLCFYCKLSLVDRKNKGTFPFQYFSFGLDNTSYYSKLLS